MRKEDFSSRFRLAVYEHTAQALPEADLAGDVDLVEDLLYDSIAFIELLVFLEDEFDVVLEDESILASATSSYIALEERVWNVVKEHTDE